MKIVCLGNAADDAIAAANRRYALTSSTSQKMVDFFDAERGANFVDKQTVSKNESSIFDKAWGIFEKLGTIATPTPKVTTLAPAPVPVAAMVGIGALAFLLYKAVK